ncbi:Golgin subfamily A member 7/ERF4 family-domain-containing protein [Chaetomidium leptoderma]|uniref:Ras modification protein ERF4 n=1 Tax=Chaetomidium leptoderma TaxID=669021 RepID=A0AAN6VMZ0_9PEZI|nr:Golgin subfamily A member 7/ERF4 family-domain-containing protein [Chaetomidium leptoderma]
MHNSSQNQTPQSKPIVPHRAHLLGVFRFACRVRFSSALHLSINAEKSRRHFPTHLRIRRRRLGDRRCPICPTASPTAAAANPRSLTKSAALDAATAGPPQSAANPKLPSPSQQPPYPPAPTPLSPGPVTPAQPSRGNSLLRRGLGGAPDSFPQSPFRTRRAAAQLPFRHLSASPPPATGRPRRQSTPPPPPIPLARPTLDVTEDSSRPIGTAAGDYPLLTLPEQGQVRRSLSHRASLHLDRYAGAEQTISLPPSLRHSYDEKRSSATPSPVEEPEPEAGPSTSRQAAHLVVPEGRRFRSRGPSFTKLHAPVGLSFSFRPGSRQKEDKGKGKAVMAPPDDAGDGFTPDLERGPDVLNHRDSTASGLSGIMSALSSSNSSIMGDPDQPPDNGEEWGPQHPCYPHLNPHVPVDSPEYANTRIIRVRRDWLLQGDLAPTFSNLYPDILDPAGVSEQEFRRVIDKLNSELVPIFSPSAWRNLLDNVLGLATGWLWDDLGFTAAKTRLRSLERWIEQWNAEMEKTAGPDEGVIPPKIVPLRRTGYMTLDIQISDPELAPASPTTPSSSRDGPEALPLDPPAVAA